MAQRFPCPVADDCRGVSTVEAALVLPVLLLLGLGIVDLTNAFGLQMQLMQAAQSGTEYVAASNAVVTDADVQAQVIAASPVANPTVTITRTLECNGVLASGTACPNSKDDAVQYLKVTASASFTPMMPFSGGFLPSGTIAQSATVRLP